MLDIVLFVVRSSTDLTQHNMQGGYIVPKKRENNAMY